MVFIAVLVAVSVVLVWRRDGVPMTADDVKFSMEQFRDNGFPVRRRVYKLIDKVEIKDPQQVTMKNGRPAIQGTCPDCGTKIFKIGKLS